VSSTFGTSIAWLRLGAVAVVGVVFLVGGALSGDWARVGGGAAVLVLVGFFALVAHVTDRARREPGTPWGRGDTAVVAGGAVVATAALVAAVVSILK
jgi:hypothetical protein